MIETTPYGPAALKVIIQCGPNVDVEMAMDVQQRLAEFMPDVRAVFLGHGVSLAYPPPAGEDRS